MPRPARPEKFACRKCGETKIKALFPTTGRTCRKCRTTYTIKWARDNPDKVRAKFRRYHIKEIHAQLWRGAKGRAKKYGHEFSLTKEWVKERIDAGTCELTGIKFIVGSKIVGRCGPYSPSIDRIDSFKGYTPDNCRVILWALNMGLSEWGEETYLHVAMEYMKKNNNGIS